jgi:catechol 2,3-dioxygenase-like lactoylglutathione lyase family enzyme
VLRIDHVVFAVPDLDAAADRFRRDHGLDSAAGGRHAGWGTANRIVPLGHDYIELIAVEDEAVAAGTRFGRAVLERAQRGGGWLAISVSTDDLDAVAGRLGLDVTAGARERPDGTEVRWRSAGLEDPRREPFLPFFISWQGAAESHPGRLRAGHGVQATGIARIDVQGDDRSLRSWLGGEDLPIRVTDAGARVISVALATHAGQLVIS